MWTVQGRFKHGLRRASGPFKLRGRIDSLIPLKFHEQFGYYAQGVAPDTAKLPRGWQRRLVRVENSNTGGYAGLCLEAHDLAISKYAAGREKDLEFTRKLARYGMTGKKMLLRRLKATKLDAALARAVRGRIERDFPGGPRNECGGEPCATVISRCPRW